MEKIMSHDMQDFALGSGFSFTGTILGDDAAGAGYTLVTIAIDESGSISGFEDQIRDMLQTAVTACFSSPYSGNLLVRVIRFGGFRKIHGTGVDEIHGFKLLSELNVNDYPPLRAGGNTPLLDALYSGVGAMNLYAKELYNLDFAVNGITFVITDGGENCSTASQAMVKNELEASTKGEVMESHVSILIGIDTGTSEVKNVLESFQRELGIDQFIWAGEATKQRLAKLAAFVSRSISSTSQALGTGGPSQQISATI
jgi:hypothetical protein